MGWGPRREVVVGKGTGGGAIGGIVIVSLGPLFIIVAFLSQTSLTSRQLDTQVLEVHILYLRRFTKLQKLHIHIHVDRCVVLDQNFKHLYHTCICKTRVRGASNENLIFIK